MLSVAAGLALLAPAAIPVSVYADTAINPTGALNCGITGTVDTNNTDCGAPTDTSANFSSLVKRIINIFSVIIGVIAVIMIILGGLRYITSGGDSGNVSGAKNTIIYALVGLVIVAFAQFIVRFVLSNAATAANG